MNTIASIALVAAAMLAPDRIQTKLNAIQAQLSPRPDPPPRYVLYDPNTVIAGFRWLDDDGPNGLIVAYRLSKDGALRRIATFKYGDDPHAIDLADVTGDGKPEVLVSGTPGNRAAPLEILRWDGKHFSELGETSTNAHFIDIDGDGLPEIIESSCCAINECDVVLRTPFVQRYAGGELVDVPMPDLQDLLSFTKTSDEPETLDYVVALENDASMNCTLHIVNGTRDGHRRATSMSIAASRFHENEPDGQKRAIPVTLTAADATVDQNVTLESRCTRFTVAVSGPRGATVAILVKSARVR